MAVVRRGGRTWHENAHVPFLRHGRVDASYWTFGFGPIHDAAAPGGVGGAFVACTETTDTVLARERSEARYKALMDGTDDGYLLLRAVRDAAGALVDMDYVECNPAAERIAGEPLAGHRLRDRRPQSWDFWVPRFERVLATGAADRLERVDERDGRVFHIHVFRPDASVLADHVALVFREVTAQRQAERRMQESEARFRLMADVAPMIVWLLDADGRAEFINRQWSQYTGRMPAAFELDEVAREVLHPEDVAPSMAAFGAAQAQQRGFELEHRIRAADGRYRWFLVRAEPYIEDGRVLRWVGVSLDIDARRRAAAESAELDRRKDEFLATLAHELRNPLAPIAASAHLLDAVADDPAEVRELAAMLGRQARHLTRLVNELLDVSRVTRGAIVLRRECGPLAPIAAAAIEQVQQRLDARGQRLDCTIDPPGLDVLADRTRLLQVVVNLLSNASQYTPPGGRIAIDARAVEGGVEIAVSDTGRGIEAELLPRVFDLFVQGDSALDRDTGGLGLGLALVKRLVELHGGRVRADSDGPGRGATFTIVLPG